MNPRRLDTRVLIERYFDSPGDAESESLEFKSKEKVDRKDLRRELVKHLTAIANTNGGTVIIGVGEGNRDDILQSFDSRSEIKRDLFQMVRDYTDPSLDPYITVNFETPLSVDLRIMRIDIEPVEHYPIRYRDPNSDEFQAYRRVGDNSKPMDMTDAVDFGRDRQPGPSRDTQLSYSVMTSITRSEEDRVPELRSSSKRHILTERSSGKVIVPTSGAIIETFEKSHLYHVDHRLQFDGVEPLTEAIETAGEKLGARTEYDFGYGIVHGDKQLMGRGASNFIDAVQNIGHTLKEMGHENVSDPRPFAVAGTPCDYGLFWIQTHYHTGSLSRNKCGVVMSNMPLDTSTLANVFGGDSIVKHKSSPQTARFRVKTEEGEVLELQNPEVKKLCTSGEFAQANIIADNPFYDKTDQIVADVDIPDSFAEAVTSVGRLPFDVAGGYSSEDKYHSFKTIDIVKKTLTIPTYFTNPMCSPHQPNSSDLSRIFESPEQING